MSIYSRLTNDVSPIKSGGLKIVENKLNKRVSDIFNVKNEIVFDSKNHYLENKQKTAQVVEQRMDNKLRVFKPIDKFDYCFFSFLNNSFYRLIYF